MGRNGKKLEMGGRGGGVPAYELSSLHETKEMFCADIRVPCKFEFNENLIPYVCLELYPEVVLSQIQITEMALKVERTMEAHLCAGRKVSLWDVISEVLLG